ncbi:MAG: DUF1704 domain-containing protein [Polyangiaceae bacterium]|nr:DUF1704 domain-containing protein [Polyangiaceae bacterium]
MSSEAWIRACLVRDSILRTASMRVPLLPIFTPDNFESQVQRVESDLRAKRATKLEFTYARPPLAELGLALQLGELASAWRDEDPLGALYADKAEEIALEARLCAMRHEAEAAALAAMRFQAPDHFAERADRLARTWIDVAPIARTAPDACDMVVSDDETDPRSLLCRMKEEVGARRLPFRVTVARSLAPLAAVGDGTIQIAPGRRLSPEDVERTVHHEIEGHVVPSARAMRAPIGLLRIGTARGSDHQEGWALLAEERASHLSERRRLEIGLRHLASRGAHHGSPFADTAHELARHCDATDLVARSVCRAYRGGGLGREAAYLPALLEVKSAFADDPSLEPVLTSGRVSLAAARVLAAVLEFN